MELRIKQPSFPEVIEFNFDELKQEIGNKVEKYKRLVYTDEQIKEAKKDVAALRKFTKALSDERIKVKKQCLQPYEEFENKINELSAIVNEPITLIDKQIKEVEEKQKQDKQDKIIEIWKNTDKPDWLSLAMIEESKWLNSSFSLKQVQSCIDAKVEEVKESLATLTNLPEFSFEATEVYKSTLDINKAISEGARLSEMAKAKAAHEAELAKRRAEEEQNAKEKAVVAEREMTAEEAAVSKSIPPKTWVKFQAFMTTEDAYALKEFFNSRNIEYKAV